MSWHCISDSSNFIILFDLLKQCGSPYDMSLVKFEIRERVLEILSILLQVRQCALFIIENCFEHVLGFFADNLVSARQDIVSSLERQNSAAKGSKKEVKDCKDLLIVLTLLNYFLMEDIEEQSDSTKQSLIHTLICTSFVEQPE